MIIDLKNATLRIKDGGTNILEIICGEGNLTYEEKKPRKYVRNWGRLHTVVDDDEQPVEVKFEFIWDHVVAGIEAEIDSDPNTEPFDGQYTAAGWDTVFGDIISGIFLWNGSAFINAGNGAQITSPTGPDRLFLEALFSITATSTNFSDYPLAVASGQWTSGNLINTFGSLLWSGTFTIPAIVEALKHTGPAANWISTSPDPCEPYCVDLEIEYDPECTGVQKEIITLPQFRYEQLTHDLRAGLINCSGKCNVVEAQIERTP